MNRIQLLAGKQWTDYDDSHPMGRGLQFGANVAQRFDSYDSVDLSFVACHPKV